MMSVHRLDFGYMLNLVVVLEPKYQLIELLAVLLNVMIVEKCSFVKIKSILCI